MASERQDGPEMASFALLNEEKKILRRKEKELERQQKINEIKAAPATWELPFLLFSRQFSRFFL